MRPQPFFNARANGAPPRDPDDLKPDANYDDRRPAEQMSGAPPPGSTSARSFAPTMPRRRSFESAAPPRSPPTPPVPPTAEAAQRPATRPAWRGASHLPPTLLAH